MVPGAVHLPDMPEPLDEHAIDRLGEQLRRPDPPPDSLLALEAARQARRPALERVQSVLQTGLDCHVVGRVKTSATILDKLRRMPHLRLSRMQDIAGVRIVLDMDRTRQDVVVSTIRDLLRGFRAQVVDRRRHPSFGYRAVHVIVDVVGARVEVQIRTRLQHAWAQGIERLATAWGRQIQYGAPPADVEAPVLFDGQAIGTTRREVVSAMLVLSEHVDVLERLQSTPAGRFSLRSLEQVDRSPDRVAESDAFVGMAGHHAPPARSLATFVHPVQSSSRSGRASP
jgi:hypothetical protein